MSTARPKVLMVGPWPPTKGGVTTFMRNVVASSLKEKYDFIPFTTSRPGKRNVRGDNYGYAAVFRGGLKRVAQGILITLWHLDHLSLGWSSSVDRRSSRSRPATSRRSGKRRSMC